ncbi:hypothetical protein PSCICE_22730 [Pseudomonas cichorii]|nr:hypothetical protein PSCICE_22730 [Pseudomonas cichorii]
MTKGKPGGPHHITLGTADIRQDCIAEIQRSQQAKKLFHGQDRDSKLNDISTTACGCQIRLAAIHDPKFNGQRAGFRIKIDPHNLTAQTAFANTLGKGTADQPETDDYKPTNDRPNG